MIDNLTQSAEIPDDLFKQDSVSNRESKIQPSEDSESEEVILVSGARNPIQRNAIKRKKIVAYLKRYQEDIDKDQPCERYLEMYPNDEFALKQLKRSKLINKRR